MPNKTNIGWCTHTSNPIRPVGGGWGCSRVSAGCDHCYASTLNNRYGNKRDFTGKWEFRLDEKELAALGRLPAGSKCFVMDMGDLFHGDVPWPHIVRVFLAMEARPDVTYQVLTKRPGRMAWFANHLWLACSQARIPCWPPNVWAGTSVESQKYARRLDVLARVPAKVRFVSVEPMLGPVDLRLWLSGWYDQDGSLVNPISWVICGGESGPGFRPMQVEWAQSLRGQCQAAGVAYWMKQDSGLYPGRQGRLPDSLWALKELPDEGAIEGAMCAVRD